MRLLGSLRTDVLKYRKRNTISVYGSVPGLHVARYRSGLAERSTYQTGQLGTSSDQYDPWSPRYDNGSMEYQPVDPWFEGMHVQRTPQIRWSGQPRRMEPVLSVSDLASDDLSEQWVEELQIGDGIPEDIDPHASLDTPEVTGEVTGYMQPDPLAEAADVPRDDLQQLVERLVGELSGAGPIGVVDGLEGQLNSAMPVPEYDELFAPMQHMYDEQLEMMLDPYAAPPGMMPPGLGPMGPMSGPGM